MPQKGTFIPYLIALPSKYCCGILLDATRTWAASHKANSHAIIDKVADHHSFSCRETSKKKVSAMHVQPHMLKYHWEIDCLWSWDQPPQ